ncbi:MAG TPA: leucyl/phenylalanyl-tRNA--protein transferase [Deltaproteobacteria bacterium]|nr:leucyl/phenylalanyl-tRNA--protein transferase [Deltaproteobacteria bacterium]
MVEHARTTDTAYLTSLPFDVTDLASAVLFMTRHPLADLIAVRPRPDDPTGMVAIGGAVTPEALLMAVPLGIFPWTGEAPIPWCSPDPRAVFSPRSIRVSRSLRKSLRNRGYRVTYDHAFDAVVRACATTPRPGQPGTWLTPNLTEAWSVLHKAGFYHSVEVWSGEHLVGGLVGMALGSGFFGDTMFHRARDASKVGFVTLLRELNGSGYTLVDAQASTPHLRSLGAMLLSRPSYSVQLKAALRARSAPGSWKEGIPVVVVPDASSGSPED